MTDYVATRTGDRVTVRHADRWTITHTASEMLADIANAEGQLTGRVRVHTPDCPECKKVLSKLDGATRGNRVSAEYLMARGVVSERDRGWAHPTADSLSAVLTKYVRDHQRPVAPFLGLPKLPQHDLDEWEEPF